ncbi:MAG TPA: TldD/PmbA family protein [Candidatus Tumulicola sp.]|jgi:PmbA protein
MDESAALETAVGAVALARTAGAGAAEATLSVARRFHAEGRENVVSKLERAIAKSLHVRLFVDGRKASLTTSDLSPGGLRAAIERTIAQAAAVAPDEFAGLPDAFALDLPELDLYDAAIETRDGDWKVEETLFLERLIRQADPRIVNSNGSHYSDATSVTALANSAGFAAAYRSSRATRSTGPVAADGATKRTAHYGTAARHFDRLEAAEAVAETAVGRAVAMFGARKPATMRVPVIFERDVASSILDDVFAAVSAANVAAGNSWLVGRTGTQVGSPLVNIVDDGRLAGMLGSAPFDGEGVATRRTTVFEAGVLRTFLFDSYYARKLGAASTGNASGSGVCANNLYLEPGTMTLDELIASTPTGVLVLDTIGFATEHASGTYSRGAHGFFIRDGEIAYPIDEFTIAGEYAEMLAAIDGVAGDLRFDGAIVSPSFRVAEMTISGN